jgi:hypothetical protein
MSADIVSTALYIQIYQNLHKNKDGGVIFAGPAEIVLLLHSS